MSSRIWSATLPNIQRVKYVRELYWKYFLKEIRSITNHTDVWYEDTVFFLGEGKVKRDWIFLTSVLLGRMIISVVLAMLYNLLTSFCVYLNLFNIQKMPALIFNPLYINMVKCLSNNVWQTLKFKKRVSHWNFILHHHHHLNNFQTLCIALELSAVYT